MPPRDGDAAAAWPPTFPRIPHLFAPADARDDRVMSPVDARQWLLRPCVVEEKLDGANVALWIEPTGAIACAGRAGIAAQDRARQLGRLRAWAAAHADAIRALLSSSDVLYAEWLYREHTIAYDALPDHLVALDLWSPASGFVSVDERDRRCQAVGIATPPILYRGILRTEEAACALHGMSVFGSEPAEGLMLRFEEAGRLVLRAKLVATGFTPKSDAAWKQAPRRCNMLRTSGAASAGLDAPKMRAPASPATGGEGSPRRHGGHGGSEG